MPFTADQKRRHRAEQAQQAGKRYKPRKHPCLRELPPPVVEAPAAREESQLTTLEEMERARMEVEDCRTRMQGVMQASASLISFYATWLQPGQRVRLRPHYEQVLGLAPNERDRLYCLERQSSQGRWRAAVAEGPHKGKPLFVDVPPEALMP